MIGTPPCLEVVTLGRFELRRNADPLSGGNWSRRKVVDLFKLLRRNDVVPAEIVDLDVHEVEGLQEFLTTIGLNLL